MTPTRKAVDWLDYLPEAGRQIRGFLSEAEGIDRKIEDLEAQLQKARDYAAGMVARAEHIAESDWTSAEIKRAKEIAAAGGFPTR